MNILITGSTGMLGHYLVDEIIKVMPEVYIGLVIRERAKCNEKWLTHPNIQIINTEEIESFPKEVFSFSPDIVIHLASYLTSSSDINAINNLVDSNIKFGTLLLNALKGTNLKVFVNTGTFAQYHDNNAIYNPTYLYAATKQAFMDILEYYQITQGFKTIHVIPYTIYGAKEEKKKVINLLIDSIHSEYPIKFSSGTQQLDFIHIEDVVEFYMKIIKNAFSDVIKNNETFFLGTGKTHSIRDVASIIETMSGRKPNIIWDAVEKRERDTVISMASTNLLNSIFNWKHQIDIETGIKKMLQEN